jgi:hypothetical protein
VIQSRAHPATLLVSLAAAFTLISGCGSGAPSDRDQIAAIIKQGGSNPSTLCSHLVDALVARLGGRQTCLRQAAAAAKDPTTHATSIRVHGTNASAVVIDRVGTRTITLVKLRSGWKVSGVS